MLPVQNNHNRPRTITDVNKCSIRFCMQFEAKQGLVRDACGHSWAWQISQHDA